MEKILNQIENGEKPSRVLFHRFDGIQFFYGGDCVRFDTEHLTNTECQVIMRELSRMDGMNGRWI